MTTVEIPEGSGNRYRYDYDKGTQDTVYKGPVGNSPGLSEEEFLKGMEGGKGKVPKNKFELGDYLTLPDSPNWGYHPVTLKEWREGWYDDDKKLKVSGWWAYKVHGTWYNEGSLKKSRRKEIDWGKDHLTEQEINLLTRRKNSGEDVHLGTLQTWVEMEGGIPLTKEQNQKVSKWLMSQWQTPTGRERKNNPFFGREIRVLNNIEGIRLKDFYMGRGRRYYPHYIVLAKDGRSFEYAVYGGEIHIIG